MKILPGLAAILLATTALEPAAAFTIAEAHLANFKVEKTASGIPLTFPGQVNLSADFNLTSPSVIRIHVVVDLSEVQRKLPAIISTIKLPSNNCGSFSGNNPVVSLTNTRLDIDGHQAKFHTNGSVAMWDCRENPVPNSEVQWQMKDLGIMKTKVPVVHTWPGDPIKNKLGTQPFAMDVPFTVQVVDEGHVRLVPGDTKLDLNGQYANLTKTILSTFKVDLNGKLNDAVSKALDPKVATAAIPKEYLDAGLRLSEANFVAVSGADDLGLDVKGSVRPSLRLAKQVARLLMRRH